MGGDQMGGDKGEVTLLLKAMQSGDPTANEKLLPLVYNELHRLAETYMGRERPGHTLQPTALIHETYLRLTGDTIHWQNRAHFIGVAANIMRRVLVDHARAHKAAIRGGNLQRVEFEEGLAISKERSNEMLALDDALSELEEVNPRQAKVVELRYFAGLSVEEIAAILKIGPRSVEREWASARVWLFERMR
jgi:RNA polymerase sigma-70 factor (ECF subfamily)